MSGVQNIALDSDIDYLEDKKYLENEFDAKNSNSHSHVVTNGNGLHATGGKKLGQTNQALLQKLPSE